MRKDELERRVAAAVNAVSDMVFPDRGDREWIAMEIITAFATELFSDPPSMWLAPMELTDEMHTALFNAIEFSSRPDPTDVWDETRDAFMQGDPTSTGDGG